MRSTFYFQHDYNSANDVKILFLRQQLGIEGYGIFWFIIEQLAQAGGRLPLKVIPLLAMQMQTSAEKVAAVIKSYELFTIEDDSFFSLRLINQIKHRSGIVEKRIEAAKSRWKLPFGEDFKRSWNEWIEHRKAIKKKMPESTINKQLKFLQQFTEQEACAIIEQSIKNGWQGLFEIKKYGNKLDIKSELTAIYQRPE